MLRDDNVCDLVVRAFARPAAAVAWLVGQRRQASGGAGPAEPIEKTLRQHNAVASQLAEETFQFRPVPRQQRPLDLVEEVPDEVVRQTDGQVPMESVEHVVRGHIGPVS